MTIGTMTIGAMTIGTTSVDREEAGDANCFLINRTIPCDNWF